MMLKAGVFKLTASIPVSRWFQFVAITVLYLSMVCRYEYTEALKALQVHPSTQQIIAMPSVSFQGRFTPRDSQAPQWQSRGGLRSWTTSKLAPLLAGVPNSALLEFSEILSTEDGALLNKRFEDLRTVFTTVKDVGKLREAVLQHPMLLTTSPDLIKQAVERIKSELPYVDPGFLLLQDKAGLELLMLCTNAKFNISDRIIAVNKLTGSRLNHTELIRKIPFVLSPRHFQRLLDFIRIARKLLDLPQDAAIEVVQSFPTVLNINLSMSLDQLNATFQREGIECSKSLMRRVLHAVPRTLLHRSTGQRLVALRRRFPRWDLQSILAGYPRILTMNISKIEQTYEDINTKLGGECNGGDINTLICAVPTILGHNITNLTRKLKRLEQEFPTLHRGYILSRVPQILIHHSLREITGKLSYLRSVFEMSQALGGNDDCNSHNETEVEASTAAAVLMFGPLRSDDEDFEMDDDENILEHDPSADSDSSHPNTLDITRIVIGNIDTFLNKYPYFILRTKAWIESYDPVMAYTVLDSVPAMLLKPPAPYRENLKFLYGKIATSEFVDGPQMRVRILLQSQESRGATQASTSGSHTMNANVFGMMSTVNNPDPNYLKLRNLLIDGPRVLRLSRQALENRCNDLYNELLSDTAFDLSSVNGAFTCLPLVSTGRLLTEPTNKIRFHRYIVSAFQASSLITDECKDAWIAHPKLLCAPLSSLLARVPFSYNILGGNQNLSWADAEALVTCNSAVFLHTLTKLSSQSSRQESNSFNTQRSISLAYMHKLESILKKTNYSGFDNGQHHKDPLYVSVPYIDNDCTILEVRIRELEGWLCGRLNSLADVKDSWQEVVALVVSA